MLFLARKNLFQEKTRLFISVGGVAFSVVLIMVLTGLYRGWNDKMGQYIRSVPADIWVVQDGTEDMFHTPSVLPLSYEAMISGLNGVEDVRPFSGRRVAFHHRGHDVNMYLVAYDKDNNSGKPARIVAGKPVPGEGEIIVDKISARTKEIKINDALDIAGQKFKVVGLSEGGDVVTFSFAFINRGDANRVFRLPDSTNYYTVLLTEGTDTPTAISDIKGAIPSVDAVTKQNFIDNNTKLIRETFLPVILVLLVISLVVGTAVIGLTIFTSVTEKVREYGVLKAIGMSNRQLYGVVMQQAFIAGLIGFAIGSLIALILQLTLGNWVPQFVSQINVSDVLLIFGSSLLMAVLASYMPIKRIARVDPAEVFKA